jgi:predicted enzyme related to lactoylglutathione lyase
VAGKIVHFEIPSGDTGRAKGFWGSLFGWEFQSFDGPMEYHMIQGTEPGGGLHPAEAGQSGLTVYFDADDVAATSARIEELGGTVVMPKTPVPSMGYFAICKDTEGNSFGIWESDESAAPPS